MYSVLYVDDESALLEIGRRFLERSGEFRIDTCTSAQEAIKKISGTLYDSIISDYQMPETDGIEFLKQVRASGSNIPFIVFTGRGREEVVIQALNEGADFYLQKGGDPRSQFVELEHKIRLAIERRRIADELSESRQRMKDIIDHLPDATFAIDLNGTVIAWNRAMEEMTGVNKDDIIGTGNHSYAIPFYEERRPILLDLILKNDEETERKYPFIIRKDFKLVSEIYIPILYSGKGAYLWFIASPLYDTHGNITGAIESIRDITDRKMAEDELKTAYKQIAAAEEELREQYGEAKRSSDALRESEERYRTLVETTDTGFVILDIQGRVLDANPHYVRMTGYRELKEILGRSVVEWTAENEKDRNREAVEQCLRDGLIRNFEVNYTDISGHITPIEINATVIPSEGSFQIITLCRDVTERKLTEEALKKKNEELRENYNKLIEQRGILRENEERYRAVFENTGTATVLIEENTIISLANEEFLRISGYSKQEVEGKKCWTEFVVAEDLERMLAQHHLRRIKREAALKHYEFRFVTRSGDVRMMLLTIDMIPGTTKSVASLMDITGRKMT